MRCEFCSWEEPDHSPACPKGNAEAEGRFWDGYHEGHRGAKCSSDDSQHKMGFLRGEVATESAENGFQLWGRAGK